MSQDNTPPKEAAKTTVKTVIFGENKALSALTFETEGGKLELGALFHVPTRHDPATQRTYYKPLACKIEITPAQRDEIIILLGGTPKCPTQ